MVELVSESQGVPCWDESEDGTSRFNDGIEERCLKDDDKKGEESCGGGVPDSIGAWGSMIGV